MAAVTTVEVDTTCRFPGPAEGHCWACGAPTRARFCSTLCGQAYAREHVWTQARQDALERDWFVCVVCGGPDVQVHHVEPLADPSLYATPGCHHHPDGLVTLCRVHHREVHADLRFADGTPARQLALPLVAA